MRSQLAVVMIGTAVFAGCGGDPDGVLVDEPDAAAVEHDAGQAVDAAPVADPVVDAGQVSAPACTPDAGVGAELADACWTLDELAARGCVAAWTASTSTSGTTTTTLAGAAAASSSAHFALLFNVPGKLTLYLCSSAAPATDWRCRTQDLADCSVSDSAQSCDVKVRVPALPTLHAICAREPS